MSRYLNPASLSHEERMQLRAAQLCSACKNVDPEVLQDGSAIYISDQSDRFYLQIFGGKSLRMVPKICGYYRNQTDRDAAAARFKQSREWHHARQMQRRQAERQPHTLKTGDVLYSDWGYEQTNIDFYEVVAVSGTIVTIRQIAATIKPTEFMQGETMPRPGQFIGEPLRRKADASNRVRITSFASASPWDGKPQYTTWYA